jgi:D-glycero-D-manno-heptose 1,7-bisphosphate phosphatase
MRKKTRQNIAVFLDRDGTINVEVDYVNRLRDFRLLPGVGRAIKALNRAGVRVIVASNQSGVARGYLTMETLGRMTEKMRKGLMSQGARLDAVYYCPYHPDEGSNYRKPGTGMALVAKKRFGLDLKKSFVVGDTRSDIEFGRNMGAGTALVLTGHSRGDEPWVGELKPDCIAQELGGAVSWILGELGGE